MYAHRAFVAYRARAFRVKFTMYLPDRDLSCLQNVMRILYT